MGEKIFSPILERPTYNPKITETIQANEKPIREFEIEATIKGKRMPSLINLQKEIKTANGEGKI